MKNAWTVMPWAKKSSADEKPKAGPRYVGVGGHLFAIAAQKSMDYGFGGVCHVFFALL